MPARRNNGALPFTHVGRYEGGIALTNAVFASSTPEDYTRSGWCTYTDPRGGQYRIQ